MTTARLLLRCGAWDESIHPKHRRSNRVVGLGFNIASMRRLNESNRHHARDNLFSVGSIVREKMAWKTMPQPEDRTLLRFSS
jgi:hypothetical protein